MTNTERDCWWQIARAAYYAGFKHVAEYIRVVQLSGHRHPDDTWPPRQAFCNHTRGLIEMIGKRVQIPAYMDHWMRGDRYGSVVRLFVQADIQFATVLMDKSGLRIVLRLDSLTPTE